MNVFIPHRILGRALGLSLADTASAQSEVFDESGDEAADHFGVATACAGDLNSDGYPDLIIGAPEGTNLFAPGESFVRVHTKKFQFWYRDPVGAGANFNLSDALSIQFCP